MRWLAALCLLLACGAWPSSALPAECSLPLSDPFPLAGDAVASSFDGDFYLSNIGRPRYGARPHPRHACARAHRWAQASAFTATPTQ